MTEYSLGIDLGAATCAAAIRRDGEVAPCPIGDESATMPAVALLLPDGTTLVGEDADTVCHYEPTLVARMVTARLGQPGPIVIDGEPCDPQALTAAIVRTAVDRAAAPAAVPPDHVVLAYPLRQGDGPERLLAAVAERVAGPGTTLVPAPVAAVAKLAHDGDLGSEAVVAVLDAGGAGVDVTVVRCTGTAIDLLGEPVGLDAGGTDLDAVVLSLVEGVIGDITSSVARHDRPAMLALRRVRTACRRAKERLSIEPTAVVEVALPHARGRVEITREAFERAAEPVLSQAVGLLESAIEDARLVPADVDRVLLTGGTANIPLLAELVSRRTGIPVAVESAPELTVALGAALFADLAGAGHADGPATGALPAGAAVATAAREHTAAGTPPDVDQPWADTGETDPRLADTGEIPAGPAVSGGPLAVDGPAPFDGPAHAASLPPGPSAFGDPSVPPPPGRTGFDAGGPPPVGDGWPSAAPWEAGPTRAAPAGGDAPWPEPESPWDELVDGDAPWARPEASWDDDRTSVFAAAPGADAWPTDPRAAATPAGELDDGTAEFRRLRTSDTDPFGSRSGSLAWRLRNRQDAPEDEPDDATDVRLIVGGVLVAVVAVLAVGFALFWGTGESDDPTIAVADNSELTVRSSTTITAPSTTTTAPTTTSSTTTTTTEEPTTTTSRPRRRTTTTTAEPAPPPPPPTVATTTTTRPRPQTTTTAPPPPTTTTSTTTTTDCDPDRSPATTRPCRGDND